MANCSFKVVMDWITLVCLCVLVVGKFIFWACTAGLWIDGFFICLFYGVSCVFVGIAPFGWAPFIDTLFAFMKLSIWRPSYIILMSFFLFPGQVWGFWWMYFPWIACIVVFIVGIIMLIIDLVDCCQKKCKCPDNESMSLVAGLGGAAAGRTAATVTHTQVIYK